MWKWESAQPQGVFVIVHGAGEHHLRYQWLIKKLNDSHFHVVAGDLPGQGKTRGKRGHIKTFTQYIDAIEGWVEAASRYELPVYLFGHSMGGLAVIRTVMERSLAIRGVVLSSPCLGLVKAPPKALAAATKVLHRVTPSFRANSGLNPEYNTRNQQVREAYEQDQLRVTKVSMRWYQELLKAMKISHKRAEQFPDLPLLLLQAGDDHIIDKYEVKKWFNRVDLTHKTYKEWEGLYHELLNEPEREDVFRYIQSFVEGE